jgi:Predicted AAA-ATPase/PD-(D/E)XK nuclease superfamily
VKKRRLPLGISDFKTLVEENYAYVDKTLLIQEVIEQNFQVVLIPRPRRFGKTLNISMLRYFFEKTASSHQYLFERFQISKMSEWGSLQGKYPVIFLTFKELKDISWPEACDNFQIIVSKEYQRHAYLLQSEALSASEKADYLAILERTASQALFGTSLQFLMSCLYQFHKTRVVVLIDEYDTPLHSAFLSDFYDPMVALFRKWLTGGLKDNPHLEKGVLTGVLRMAKESIFSGLNNLGVFSLLRKPFSDKFGLTEPELAQLLQEYGSLSAIDQFRDWYNGYRMGVALVYNPWSILQCLDQGREFQPYWLNTSDNELIKQLLTKGGEELKSQLEPLLKGEVLKKPIQEGIVFESLKHDVDTVWSLLLFSGYLTIQNIPSFEDGLQCELKIPNKEVRYLFEDVIKSWFTQSINKSNFHLLLKSLTDGDVKTFSEIFQDLLRTSMSVYDIPADEPEKVYHAFVLGLLISLKDDYEIKSNRESGYGRYDVMLIPKKKEKIGIIFEFKKVRSSEAAGLGEAADEALKQIVSKRYSDELHLRGVKDILLLGLAFRDKEVVVKEGRG